MAALAFGLRQLIVWPRFGVEKMERNRLDGLR